MKRNLTCSSSRKRGVALLVGAACALLSLPVLAQEQTKVACIGEQTTHSAHRENDPEYPFLMGPILDEDFAADDDQHPDNGGFLYGGGMNFRIGNFGVPKGSVLNQMTGDASPVLGSNELTLAETFEPDVVVLGPFGAHEAKTNRSMDNFTDDLILLIERIEEFPSQPDVLIALPVPHGAGNGGSNGPIYQQAHDESAAVAADRGLQTIDLWTPFTDQGQFFQDATHLTVSGREKLAELVGAAVLAWAEDQDNQGTGGAGNGGMGGSAGSSAGGMGGETSPGGTGNMGGTSSGGAPAATAGSGGMVDSGGTAGSTTTGGQASGGSPAAAPTEMPSLNGGALAEPTAPPEGTGCAVAARSSRNNPAWAFGLAALMLVVGGRRTLRAKRAA